MLDRYERQRGHRYAGGQLGTKERERHWVIAVALGAVAAAAAGYAQYRQSQVQAQQQQYQAKVAKNQAAQAQYNAQINAENQRVHNLRVMGAQRAALGASGVDSGEGSPLFVEMDSFTQGRLEEQRLRYGGQVRSDALISESAYLRHNASQTAELGYVNAGVSLLGGVASAAGAYSARSGSQQGSG